MVPSGAALDGKGGTYVGHETVVPYPVGLEFGPDGALYLTYPAWGPNAGDGLGALLRIDVTTAPISLAGVGTLPASCGA